MREHATLTPKQQRFVEEYLIDLNGTQAARRAGYSPRTANEQAAGLLAKLSIQNALVTRQQELRNSSDVTPERVIREYARLAFADMADYVSWGVDGVIATPSDELPEGASRAVAEVTETITDKGRTFRFKLHDKKGALDSLAKHLGMFQDATLPPSTGQQLLPGQREVSWRVVYDSPPQLPEPVLLELEALTNGHSDNLP